jgi:hypothetical protein
VGIGTHTAPVPTSEPASIDDLADGLREVIRKGLPIGPDRAPEVLLALRGVYARSINPDDYLSRVKSLNQLLTRMLARLGDGDEAVALRTLFGLPAENRGVTLTVRRERAAAVVRYGATHFRKHIEGRLLRDFAWLVHEDSQTYTPRSRKAPPIHEVSGDTPSLSAADVNAYEELASRIWSYVYGLRAELIRQARLEADGNASPETRAECGRDVVWSLARLLTRIHEYIDRFGDEIVHGEAEFRVDSLVRLAGWRADLTAEQAQLLRLAVAKVGEDDRAGFLMQLATSSEAATGTGSGTPQTSPRAAEVSSSRPHRDPR